MLSSKCQGWRVRVESTTGADVTSVWFDVATVERADAESRAMAKVNTTDPGKVWRVTYSEPREVERYRTKAPARV